MIFNQHQIGTNHKGYQYMEIIKLLMHTIVRVLPFEKKMKEVLGIFKQIIILETLIIYNVKCSIAGICHFPII